jgi:hypothetical protein
MISNIALNARIATVDEFMMYVILSPPKQRFSSNAWTIRDHQFCGSTGSPETGDKYALGVHIPAIPSLEVQYAAKDEGPQLPAHLTGPDGGDADYRTNQKRQSAHCYRYVDDKHLIVLRWERSQHILKRNTFCGASVHESILSDSGLTRKSFHNVPDSEQQPV